MRTAAESRISFVRSFEKLSTDNLLDQTVQYQNESVSSHELNGIENYNLLQNQNHRSSSSQSGHHSGKNVRQNNDQNLVLVQNDCGSSSNIFLSSKESLSSVSVFLATKTNSSAEQETASLKNLSDFCDVNSLVEHTFSTENGFEDNNDSSQVDNGVKLSTRLVDVAISIGEKNNCCEEPLSAFAALREAQEDVTPLDSLDDNSSHETNSIEEALRALDHAINGEHESTTSEDERNFVDYLGTVHEERIDGVRNEFCIEKNSSSDSGMEEAEISEKNVFIDVSQQAIREVATKLVDEILLLCQNRVEKIRKYDSHDVFERNNQDDDFDDFNKTILFECSTPFVSKNANFGYKNSFTRHALFNINQNDTYVQDHSWQELKHERRKAANDCMSSNISNQTGDYSINENDDDLEQIYPLNETVEIAANNAENNLGNPAETFIKDDSDNLPVITIDNSMNNDALSDKPTATPMNTPIEQGYPTTIDWDEWLSTSTSSSTICRNSQIREKENYFSSQTIDNGWFLHAESEYDKANENTFEIEENNESLDSTYDLLRRQLTEMLSHAQSAKEPADRHEENDSHPDHYGIQYGDLDEASNAPSASSAMDNELIINYKRTLSPIIEESEDESFYNKASFYKESSNFVESTSTGCMGSTTAMGINRTLMASNDTLFNFEEMLDEILSPRISSQSHTPINREKEIPDYFLRSPRHESTSELSKKVDTLKLSSDFAIIVQQTQDSSLSSPGDQAQIDNSQSSSIVMEEKTCVYIGKPAEDNERISEISEPILVSSTSCPYNHGENSLLDAEIPSIVEDSFNKIVEREKPLDNEQCFHGLDFRYTAEPEVNVEPPERDENCDPATSNSSPVQETVYLQNKLNLENTYNNCTQDTQAAIESIDRFLLKTKNMSLLDEKSTNSVGNDQLSICKVSSISDGKNVSINHDK
ncbi:uncharacterized protein LOC129721824 isoform X2 [Wyeomyia smithii]|uniref:uncharacterized protein LOC129721824 isoform X2 n=1 Tax=Wyeomyia smithii TaxID=174621 RepID=UPI002467C1EC|nr:uncharacterized protein LOC129721824 isoform X2 [Wyeomyia smithii]XP_055530817.1 uncharacterized protein LOC129721824 isoform X2 [Wyeomyia smithii]